MLTVELPPRVKRKRDREELTSMRVAWVLCICYIIRYVYRNRESCNKKKGKKIK